MHLQLPIPTEILLFVLPAVSLGLASLLLGFGVRGLLKHSGKRVALYGTLAVPGIFATIFGLYQAYMYSEIYPSSSGNKFADTTSSWAQFNLLLEFVAATISFLAGMVLVYLGVAWLVEKRVSSVRGIISVCVGLLILLSGAHYFISFYPF